MKRRVKKNQNQGHGEAKKVIAAFIFLLSGFFTFGYAQVNTDRMIAIGRNALYFEDYVLSIQYFNQVIKAKPYLAEPYLYRAIAKFNLDDYKGAESDISLCLERNPFLVQAYQCRGGARQNLQDYKGAIQDYNKGLEFRPEDRQMLINKGIAYLQLKDYNQGIGVLDTLIAFHPKFTQAYLVRGAAYTEKEDTLKAMADFDTAIRIDKYFAPSYGQRGLLYFKLDSLNLALSDLNMAIHLDPIQDGYYINRGLIRYHLNDLRGAMSDYDVVINKESNNIIARFNRGLLRAQVGDNNRAIEDFGIVIQQEPDNYMAIFNRALLREEVGEYSGAIADYNRVLAEYPNFLPGYYARSQAKRALRDVAGADKDYWYAYDLEEKLNKERAAGKKVTGKGVYDADDATETADLSDKTREKSDKNIEKFNRLVVYDKEEEQASRYNNELRGKVQDRQVKIDLEPPFVITYYEKIEVLKGAIQKDKILDDYNKSGYLSSQLIITNKEAAVSDEQANEHFRSIDHFSLKITQNPSDANAYFGRAMDFMIVQDLNEALNDFSSAVQYAPGFTMAYFNRAVVRYKLMEINQYNSENTDSQTSHALNIQIGKTAAVVKPQAPVVDDNKEQKRNFELELIIRDYDTCIRLNPDFVYAYFNKGNIRCLQKDYRSAVLEYNEAIKRNPDFAEAYFNRGLTRLSLGDTDKGIEDLSKAGELGIIDAYGIIKRMTE